MKLLKTSLKASAKITAAISLLAVVTVAALLLSPLKIDVQNALLMEINAHLNDLISAPDSSRLGPLHSIDGPPPQVHQQPLANLRSEQLNSWMEGSLTEALIIQRDGEIIHESYSPQANLGLAINSMSMSKNIIVLLVGIAIEEGLIESEHSSIRQFLPQLRIDDDNPVSFRDLLNHISGIESGLSEMDITLGGADLNNQQLSALVFGHNREFRYDNINYYLIQRALSLVYQRPLNQLVADKLWRPMNLEQAKTLNSTGYCCVFATGRSWLAIGQLYLNGGMYYGKQIVPRHWIAKITTNLQQPDWFFVQATGVSEGNQYGYHIYSGLHSQPDYYWIEGMGLQVIMINPVTKVVIVRLGRIPSLLSTHFHRGNLSLIDELLTVIEKEPSR
jgi:CubicO group peptidase (beta-lactamase class C family)